MLRNHQSPGDIVALTAAVRDLHRAHGEKFAGTGGRIQVETSCPAVWENNPHVTVVRGREEYQPNSLVIEAAYPAIHQSNQRPQHFIAAFVENLEKKLGVPIPITAFKGDIHLTQEERRGSWDEVVAGILRGSSLSGDILLNAAASSHVRSTLPRPLPKREGSACNRVRLLR